MYIRNEGQGTLLTDVPEFCTSEPTDKQECVTSLKSGGPDCVSLQYKLDLWRDRGGDRRRIEEAVNLQACFSFLLRGSFSEKDLLERNGEKDLVTKTLCLLNWKLGC